ncbi:hypothetical protein PHYBOEH_007913 [Phytophthora boehmeriae]|uniref:Uncharacterized protein n=1 Tax=Phytophthora boehmeriae TaxID=109152 RepID=A0A8T1W4S4_9STRA|nr:hypothetical protein PHYBOEH_007913 [Phytophthora boehmeriae]
MSSIIHQSQQLSGLSELVVNLKTCLEIMSQKREEMAIAFAACEGLDLDIKVSSDRLLPGLEASIYESSWGFIEDISLTLRTLTQSVDVFQATPSVWHFCKSEDQRDKNLAR